MITGATLFSGIGAPETAMPHWRWPWHAEIEKFSSAVMAQRRPESVNVGDVTSHEFTERAAAIARPGVLVFGSPCQSFSIAGKRLGLDDPRGNLALCALGIVARLEPRWFVFENVPGLLSSSEGRDFGLFLRAVDELGYSLAWAVLDAQHFGVAQRRERVFAVGHLGDWRGPAAVLLEPEGLCGDTPPRRKAGEGAADPITASFAKHHGASGGKDSLPRNHIANPLGSKKDGGWRGDLDNDTYVAHALNGHGGPHGRQDFESETFVTHALRADGFDASEDGTGRGTPLVTHALTSHSAGSAQEDGIGRGCPIVVAFQCNWTNVGTGDIAGTMRQGNQHATGGAPMVAFSCKDHGADASDIAPTLRAMGHTRSHPNAGGKLAVAFDIKGVLATNGASETDIHTALRARKPGQSEASTTTVIQVSAAAFHENQRAESTLNDTAGSLKTGGGKPGQGYPAAMVSSAVRRLTPRECERLQGYPDDYTLITYRGRPAADGPRYKALGNSMAVPVMRWILARIEALEATE